MLDFLYYALGCIGKISRYIAIFNQSEKFFMHTGAKRADVAKEAGVAQSTVSRALTDSPLISHEVKERVRAAARRLGYVPDMQARQFAKRRTYRLGLVVRAYRSFPPFSRAYFPAVLDGALLAAQQRGYSVTVLLDKNGDEYIDLVSLVKSRIVDGLLLLIVPIGDMRIDRLIRNKIPFVLINDYRDDCMCIDGTPMRGMRMAFEHMLAEGHRKFGFISGDMNYRNARDRLDTFNRLAQEFSLEHSVIEGDFSRTSGYRYTGSLLQNNEPPTVIMTSSDRQAFGVLDYCREHGLQVPNDVSVVGYDNLFPARDTVPALTTVDNQVQQAGASGTELLIDAIENKNVKPMHISLETGFVVRQSTGPCRKGRG
jgi:LacI family transcriptional regulator